MRSLTVAAPGLTIRMDARSCRDVARTMSSSL
jgi:hypothetical protein